MAVKKPNLESNLKKREVVIQGFEKKAGLSKRLAEELEKGVLQVACPNGELLLEGSENFKIYKSQYKRLCTHIRQNKDLVIRLANHELEAAAVATMDDDALMADEQRSVREQFRQEGLQEALGMTAEDSAHWTPSNNYTCPRCDGLQCIYIQTFKGSHQYDDNVQEPAITIRCINCKHLWKEDEVEGGRLAAGAFVIEPSVPLEDASTKSETDHQPDQSPSLWHEGEGRKAPTWLLPASA